MKNIFCGTTRWMKQFNDCVDSPLSALFIGSEMNSVQIYNSLNCKLKKEESIHNSKHSNDIVWLNINLLWLAQKYDHPWEFQRKN